MILSAIVEGGGRKQTDEVFADRLIDGESIVWSARPGQGIIFMWCAATNIPVSLLLLGFLIYGTTLGTHTGAPGFPWFGCFVTGSCSR